MTKTIITLIILLALLGGGIAFFSKDSTEPIEESAMTMESYSGNLKNLLSNEKNLTCTFSKEDEFGKMDGTVFVANNKFYGEFTLTTLENEEFKTNIIHDTEYNYTWGSSPAGDIAIKFKNSDEEKLNTTDDDENNFFNPNEEIDYKCDAWSVDDSVFTPPSEIEFMNLSSQFMDIEDGQQADGIDAKCDTCEMIPDEKAKAQCKVALQCS